MYGIYIYTYIYHKNQLDVGKYASPMDVMEMGSYWKTWTISNLHDILFEGGTNIFQLMSRKTLSRLNSPEGTNYSTFWGVNLGYLFGSIWGSTS